MTGATSTIGVGVQMFLRDQFSGPSRRINKASDMMRAKIEKMDALRHTRNLNAGLATMGVVALASMGRLVGVGAQYGYTMKFVEAVTKSAGKVTSVALAEMDKRALKLGRTTMFTAQQVASGMHFLAKAGMTAQEVLGNIDATVSLAGATGSVLGGKGGAADIMTNLMRAFQLESTHSTRVADVLVSAVNSANVSLTDVGEAGKYAANTLEKLNIGIEDTAAMFMLMGNAGIQGTMAGTAVDNAFRYLSKTLGTFATGRQTKAMEMLGLTFKDLTRVGGQELKPVSEIFKIIGEATKQMGMGTLGQQQVIEAIFGVRGKRAALMLVQQMTSYDKLLNKISYGSAGESARLMDAMMGTLQGSILKTRSAWETLKIAFTKGITPTLQPILNGITSVLDKLTGLFNRPFWGTFFATAIGGFIVLKTVTWTYRAVKAGLKLITLQNQAAFANRVKATVAGYAAMGASARGYAAATRYGAFMGGGGVMYSRARTGAAGPRIGRMAGAAAKAGRGTPLIGGILGGLIGRMGVGAAARTGAVGIGKIAAILSGPWGMAITMGLMILPPLISGVMSLIKKNRAATEDNTEATIMSSEQLKNKWAQDKAKTQADNQAFVAKEKEIYWQRLMNRQKALYFSQYRGGGPSEKYRGMDEFIEMDRFGNVNIFIDGKKAISTELQRRQTQEIYEQLQ